MLETSSQRKVKISLEDYDYRQDIENRLLMGQFSSKDLEVLEEILYSSITIPIKKLMKNLDLEEEEITPILQKLSKTGLFGFENDAIVVDKEMRKYFESQILKFDPDFKPGMEFLQSLMRKVPIHVLPVWYSIPRTSNNIFDSLVEKYLLTPQIFYRYLMELNLNDAKLMGIIHDVYHAPDFQMFGKDLIEKYGLTREQFEEYLLLLEFHLVCCLGYTKVDDAWEEVVSPYYEWREYLTFLRDTEPSAIQTPAKVNRLRPEDFSFIQDMSALLNLAKKQPLQMKADELDPALYPTIAAKLEGIKEEDSHFKGYLNRIVGKLRLLKLADVVDKRLYALDAANDWLDMRAENRAIYLYRHPLNRLEAKGVAPHLCNERAIREAEKSITRVLNTGWVYFDDFLRGVIVPLGEDSVVMLKKQGKTWKYSVPVYDEEQNALIHATVMDWLFEVGITAIGVHQGRECFCVTPYGQSLFGR
ncbi:MAG: hypothetical protein K2P51_01125 [Rhabdochlamydiaceae bacterium]|nr:hypothetical protein [Rhabdochlamydiaceae bacterium]